MKDDAVLLMQRPHEVSHLRSEHAFHRPLLEPDDVNLDIPGAQRGGGFEPDKARPDHNRAARAVADAMIARQSASERSTWTWGWSAPGIGRRTGSAPVASSRRS